jgi:hypothetical protein
MDRNPAQGGVTPAGFARRGLRFSIAGEADDAELRALLAGIAMDGWIRLASTREPDSRAAHRALGHDGEFIIVRDLASGGIVGCGEYTTSRLFLNGEPCVVPYFGALRVAPSWRNRIGPLRDAYDLARQFQAARGDPPFLLSSIGTDNARATRLLSANLPGMPDYHPLGRLVTLAIATSRGRCDARLRVPTANDLAMLAERLMAQGRRTQFMPVWDEAHLRHVIAHGGMSLDDFRVIQGAQGLQGAIAVWDQRRFKQVLAAGYAPWLGRLRPAVNLALGALRRPVLPQPGSTLNQVYLSHAVLPERLAEALALIGGALWLARQKGAGIALLGLAADHPMIEAIVGRFGALRYETGLYLVTWKAGPPPPRLAAGLSLAPDIAML